MQSTRPTFKELAALEPKLADILEEARTMAPDGPSNCRHNLYISGTRDGKHQSFKRRLSELVGWQSCHGGILTTSAAFDVVVDTVLAALPDCQYCTCMNADGYVWWMTRQEPLPGTQFPDGYLEMLAEGTQPGSCLECAASVFQLDPACKPR